MKATFSSSLRCKRLIQVLVVLLPLFCIRLFGESPFDAYKESIQDQIEEEEVSLEFSLPSIITSIEDHLEHSTFNLDSAPTPLPFMGVLPAGKLPSKVAAYQKLKNLQTPYSQEHVNLQLLQFSKNISLYPKNFQLESIPFIAEKNKPLLAIDPNLEQKKETKHDFLSKKSPLNLKNLPSHRFRPYSFELPQNEESSLINHHFTHKKSEQGVSSPLKEFKTTQQTFIYIAEEKRKRELPSPTSEKVDRRCFHVDDYYFYFDDSFPLTSPYPLESHLVFNVKLIKDCNPQEKKIFSEKESFAEGYFKSLEYPEVSRITKEKAPVAFLPSLETIEDRSHPYEIQLCLEASKINSYLLGFKEISIAIDLPYLPTMFQNFKFCQSRRRQFDLIKGASYAGYRNDAEKIKELSANGEKIKILKHDRYKSYQQEKTELEFSTLAREAFEATAASKLHYPLREKNSPIPSKYPLFQNPTIVTKLNHRVTSFTLTSEFDFYCSKETINLPKKTQEFHQSVLITEMYPYLYMESHENFDEKTLIPKPEKQTPLTFSETIDTLTIHPSTDTSSPPIVKRQGCDPLAMISRSIEFPHFKTSPLLMELSLDAKDFLRLPLETSETSLLFFPSTEKTPPLVSDSTLNLEIASETSSETFPLSQNPFPFDPTLKPPTLPKHHQKTLLSELNIKGNYILINKSFTEGVIIQHDYQPSLQKGEKNVSKTFPNLSFPKLQNSFLALETKKKPPIEIRDSEVQFEKFANREATKRNSHELSLPQVKRKEIFPKTETRIPSKLVEDVPHIQSIATLIKRTDPYSNVKSHSFNPSHEDPLFQYTQRPILNPLHPTYYPPQVPGLDIATGAPSIKEKNLEYVKKKIAPFESSPENLILPHVAGKKILPNKAVMKPKKAFEDLSEYDKVICLANRDERFSNTREILEGNPVPVRIQSEITFSEGEFSPLKTGMIRSQSKKILENYHEETLVSSRDVTLASPELEGPPSDSEKRSLNQSKRFTNAFLTEIPSPSYLETVSYNNEFDTSVHYCKREDGKGYLFSIKMKPSQNLNFASPHQHYIFVVDGSSSIKKHRFGVFKEGVGRALSYLGEGDSFNIVIADAEMIPFSKQPTPWSKTSVSKAKCFLMDQNYRGFFINYNAFDLLSTVSNYFAPDKENIVVLITDGHSFKPLQDHKNDFNKFNKESQGKFSVFTATASQGNNLSMLDLLSTFNNGELMYSKTNASFSRQLSVLVKHIESFVAKDIHVNVTRINSETGIEFYPNEKTLPALYADRPYIVYGCIDELKDFDLILQGRCGDKWINIKQTISFKYAEKATHSIRKGIAMQKAYVCYDYFLKSDDPFFLKEAQNILEPLHIPTAVR